MNEVSRTKYINDVIGFYFEGGFEQAVLDAQLDSEEIQTWLNIAVLFKGVANELNQDELEPVLVLLESLYIACEVEQMTEGDISKVDISEVFEGYDYSKDKFLPYVNRAHEMLVSNGMRLNHLATK